MTIWARRSRRNKPNRVCRRRPSLGFRFYLCFCLSRVVRKLVASIQRAIKHTDRCFRGIWDARFAALVQRAVPPSASVQIENNVFAQIGLVMIIGLVAKNAILIVEFAKVEYERGTPLVDAALAAARLRLRPILMTSFAFILGCVPLWMASGSGAVARQVMGTTVIGGMFAACAIAIFLIPASFCLIEKLVNKGGSLKPGQAISKP